MNTTAIPRVQVQIGVRRTHQGRLQFGKREQRTTACPEADRSDAGQQAEPIGSQDKKKQRRQQRESLRHHVRPNDAFKHVIKGLDHGLEDVLGWREWARVSIFAVARRAKINTRIATTAATMSEFVKT